MKLGHLIGSDLDRAAAKVRGKSDVHHLEREDLAALTVEAAAMAKIKLAGTNWIPGLKSGRGTD